MFRITAFLTACLLCGSAFAQEDPYQWLEQITSDTSLNWVRRQNAHSTSYLKSFPEFEQIRAKTLSILDSPQRIPYVGKIGAYYYNFWRDASHPRGIWRRTTLDQYRLADPQWETVLDVDQLATDEKQNWFWRDAIVRKPDNDLCLVCLSRGGADAVVVREFDLNARQFVAGGFELPEAKSNVSWLDQNDLYVGTDFGPGSMTSSGYPRVVKLWKRGTPLSDATLVFQGQNSDVVVSPAVEHDHGHFYEFMDRGTTIFNDEVFVHRGGDWVHLDKPADANWSVFGSQLLLQPRTDWNAGGQVWPAGSLLAIDFDAFLKGDRNFAELFTPAERTTLENFDATKNYLILNETDNIISHTVLMHWAGDHWEAADMPAGAPGAGTVSASGVDSDDSDQMFLSAEDFLHPPSLCLATAGQDNVQTLKSLPALFDTSGLEIQQHEATSKDGTKIPYFQVSRKDMNLDGNNLTLLYGYGGFEISLLPEYSPAMGSAWLSRGNVYVLANIRGGGEFGPKWHDAARKENRQKAYDDFEAVAEDLESRGVTSPKHLGIQGGSNGGLLMGVMLTQRPDLFGAVVCGSPLLDMKRYTHLLAGASWMDEYGDPDNPKDWAFISKYSPYQNARADRRYPPVLITTSTRDDRVDPAHARKMAARLEAQGHDVLFYEEIEGGHSAGANHAEIAFTEALEYTFLLEKLK